MTGFTINAVILVASGLLGLALLWPNTERARLMGLEVPQPKFALARWTARCLCALTEFPCCPLDRRATDRAGDNEGLAVIAAQRRATSINGAVTWSHAHFAAVNSSLAIVLKNGWGKTRTFKAIS